MTDHRAVAAALVGVVGDVSSSTRGETDPTALSVTAQAAIVHALLAVEARLGEQVGQQRLANYLSAMASNVRPSQFDSWETAAHAGLPFGRRGTR